MPVSQESPEAIAEKLHYVRVLCKQGRCISEAVRQVGLTQRTYRRWRQQYGGLSLEEIRWTRQLKDESRWPAATMH